MAKSMYVSDCLGSDEQQTCHIGQTSGLARYRHSAVLLVLQTDIWGSAQIH